MDEEFELEFEFELDEEFELLFELLFDDPPRFASRILRSALRDTKLTGFVSSVFAPISGINAVPILASAGVAKAVTAIVAAEIIAVNFFIL